MKIFSAVIAIAGFIIILVSLGPAGFLLALGTSAFIFSVGHWISLW
jgi:hypothetical protein